MNNKYAVKKILNKFMTGTWKNEFSLSEKKGFEICKISENGIYTINGEHWFNIKDLKFNTYTNKITFNKTAIKPGDFRKFYNELLIINRNLISGTYYLSDSSKPGNNKKNIPSFSLKYIRLKK